MRGSQPPGCTRCTCTTLGVTACASIGLLSAASAIGAFKAPFEARLTAHATDSNAEDFFGDDFAGSRIEAALQVSF